MPVSVSTTFDCDGCLLLGVFEEANSPPRRGVLIVVGGPQYRVGSHRQFTLLSRDLAKSGFTTLRFDHRGAGDSGGDTDFEDMGPDIGAAIDAFVARYPSVEEVVLWGLCDAASAILMYAPSDARVRGLVLLNPWVRSEQSLAQSYLSSYYLSHVLQADFWRRLISGKVGIASSVRELWRNVLAAMSPNPASSESTAESGPSSGTPFQVRMMDGLKTFGGETLIILSGKDLTANEFKIYVNGDRKYRRLLTNKRVRVLDFPEADHTFSTAGWRAQVAHWTVDWLRSW